MWILWIEAVDIELHIRIHCDFHSRDRQILFSPLVEIIGNIYRLTDIDTFRKILSYTRQNVIFALGKFIFDGLKSRDRVSS